MCAEKDKIEITPEALASALYDVLDRNQSSTVAGDPKDKSKTTIDGRWDLVEVAQEVLLTLRSL
jgi:hypothetical protein